MAPDRSRAPFSEDDPDHVASSPIAKSTSATPDDGVLTPESFAKWAGKPGPGGGLAGSYSEPNPSEDNYDPQKKPGPFVEVGAFGLAQYGGFIRDEFLKELQGDKALSQWREMWDNDPIVGGFVFAVQMLMRKVEWRVEPAEAATVEDIVAERMAERQSALQEQHQAQQQALMQQQSGLAANAQGQPGRGLGGPNGKPGQPSPPQMGRSGLASPAQANVGIHQGVGQRPGANGQVGTGPMSTPLSPNPGNATPDGQPGANPTHPQLGQGSNAPDLTGVPDIEGRGPLNPGTNPGGGPAQQAALDGHPGMGPGNQSPTQRRGIKKWFAKAESGGSGGSSGQPSGFDASDPDDDPTDPETNLGLEYAPGTGPDSITPQARAEEELAVFVETCFHDLDAPWSEVVAQIVTFIVFGWSYHELVYKKRNGPNPDIPEQGSRFSDGRVGWAKIATRAQETRHRWEFDDHGNIMGMWQLAPPKFQMRYLPLSKCLLFRTTAYKNNPEGRSALRSAWVPWYYKKRIQEYEAIGVERDLAGLPVARVPYDMMTAGATPQQKAVLVEIKHIVRNLHRNEQAGVVWPSWVDPETKQDMFGLELLSGSGSARSFDTDKIITRYEQRMAMTVLADFIMLGHDAVGARSLGETKADLFTTALEAWLQVIADVFNTYAIPRLLQMNGEDPASCPRLVFGKMETISLEELASIITAMSGAGAMLFPDTQLEDYIRERASMPPKASTEEL